MIIEEVIPHRIRDLLASSIDQHSSITRLIVEARPDFHPSRLRHLLKSDRWPHAVNPNLVIDRNSKNDQMARAAHIVSQLIKRPLDGKKFLDFGCGEGYVSLHAEQLGAISVGYDTKEQWSGTTSLSSDWGFVEARAPYDVVLVYDVLDHSEENPVECLKKIKKVLGEGGIVVVRCHPWCSRNGTHCYTSVNKAFLHYFFTEDELYEMGAPGIFTRKVLHPLSTYENWFKRAGLVPVSEEVRRQEVEKIFYEEPILRSVIQDQWKMSYEEELANGSKFPVYQIEQNWCDYTLVSAEG